MGFRAIGEAPFDRWTIVHLASGWLMGKLRISPVLAVGSIIGFEIFEAWLRHNPDKAASFLPKGFIENESVGNVIADVIAGLVGYAIGLESCAL